MGRHKKKRLFGPGDESAVLIIVLHTSSVLVTVHKQKQKKKPKLIQPGKTFRLMFGIFPEFGGLLQDAGRFYRNFRSKSKTPVCNHFGPHGALCLALRWAVGLVGALLCFSRVADSPTWCAVRRGCSLGARSVLCTVKLAGLSAV